MSLTESTTPDLDWLTDRVRRLIDDDGPIQPDDDLMLYGLDSIAVMRLILELEEKGILISFDDLAQAPTLNGWHRLIQARSVAPPST